MIYQHPLAYLVGLQAHRDPADAPPTDRVLPQRPSDIWTLRAWYPAAAYAACSGNPMLIFWDFEGLRRRASAAEVHSLSPWHGRTRKTKPFPGPLRLA